MKALTLELRNYKKSQITMQSCERSSTYSWGQWHTKSKTEELICLRSCNKQQSCKQQHQAILHGKNTESVTHSWLYDGFWPQKMNKKQSIFAQVAANSFTQR